MSGHSPSDLEVRHVEGPKPTAQYNRNEHRGTGPQINGPFTEGDHGRNNSHLSNVLWFGSGNKGTLTIAVIALAIFGALAITLCVIETGQHTSGNES